LDVDKKKGINKKKDDNDDRSSSYNDKVAVVPPPSQPSSPSLSKSSHFSFKELLKSLGPGVITGAANEDPTTITAYSQAGAQFGFGMLWLALFQYPMLAVFQEMCARIGLVTGGGLAAAIKSKYPKDEKQKAVVILIASLILIANTINLGADIGAMAASVRLVFPQLSGIIATLCFTGLIVSTVILVPYKKYVKILKYLVISILAYVITAIIVGVGGRWDQILVSSIIPHFEFTPAFALILVASFGATMSPYTFFWQTSEQAEEDVVKHKITEISGRYDRGSYRPKISKREFRLMRLDVAIGMALAQLIMWSVITTTAGSLHTHGITDIQTADQAAKALQPLVKTFPNSGEIAKTIFALGIIGTGMLAVSVMAGASGYVLSDALGWKEGLSKKFTQAKKFYVVIAASTVIGLWINLVNIDPIKALLYTAIINGVVAIPIFIAIMRIANDRKILKDKVNGKISNVIGCTTIVIMAISVVTILLLHIWQYR
jgi:NRAMP (natural resistance-associated macrophage protein)-like metal ion transporter